MSVSTVSVDLAALELDPYPTYEQLRRWAPVCHVPEAHAWFVTRWHDVQRVARDAATFSAAVHTSPLSAAIGPNLLHSEGESHARQRAPLTASLRPSAVRALMERAILETLDELVPRLSREPDLVRDLADPLSIRVLRRVSGLPDIDDAVLRWWVEGISLGASNYEKDPVKDSLARSAGRDLDEAVERALRDGVPEGSLLHVVSRGVRRPDPMTLAEVCATTKLLVIGGMQEPRDLLGTALHVLMTHPEVRNEVMSDLARGVPRLIEESLRWCSPVGTVTRVTRADTELSGITLPAGAVVAAVLASANRDPDRWDDPQTFQLNRRDHQHLAFAAGTHTCVGAALARREVELALHRLLTDFPHLDATGPAPFKGWEFRGPTALPVRLKGRAQVTAIRRTDVHQLTVARRVLLTPSVVELTFASDGDPLPSWSPGAHVDVHLPGSRTRQYSLCGSVDDETWSIAVRRDPYGRGGSLWMHDGLGPGDVVAVGGPRNHFPLKPASAYCFVAGGIGITALLPMVEQVCRSGQPWSLLYIGSELSCMPYVDHPLLRGPETTVVSTAVAGRPDSLIDESLDQPDVYCCGPEGLIRAVESAARDRGLAIHVERFVASPPAEGPRPAGRPFLARLDRTDVTVAVAADESLLDRLAAEGVLLPSSCRSGTCGSCEVVVLAGRPEHHDEVLTGEERERGDVLLACVSRSRDAELVLDL